MTKKSSLIYYGVAVLFFGIAVCIYLGLIWSNCGATGPSSFFEDVRQFHTADGC